jgi:lipopolysaccharide exporter
MSSLANQTARAAALMIVAGLVARLVGVTGSLVMTHIVAPEVIGEAAVAYVIAATANSVSVWGFGQYLIVKGRGDDAPEVAWHVTVFQMVNGTIGLGLVALLGGYLTPFFGAPGAAAFVPGMALAVAIRRLGSVPEKFLVQDMKFRAIAVTLFVGETAYAITSVALASRGWGSNAVVVGNIVQASLITLLLISAAGVKRWTTPVRLRLERFRDMVRFGLPLAAESVAHNASREWSKLMMSRYFMPGPMALYNMAYNLADIPAVYVGEQIAQVLLPSMSKLPPERRPRALEKATALLSLIIFPLAVGLGVVARPLIRVGLGPEWQEVAPLLMILAALSVFRPVTWVLSTYLEAQAQTGRLMVLEWIKVVILLVGIWQLSRWGIEWASVAVGLAFGFNAIAGAWIVAQDGPSPWRMTLGFVQPLICCLLMGIVVELVYVGLYQVGIDHQLVHLIAGIVSGAATYVVSALIICRATAKEFLGLLREVISRRRSR